MCFSAEEWEKINDAVKMINAVSLDEKAVRKNILRAIHSLIYYDFGDFCHAVHDEATNDTIITDPVSLTRYSREFQMEYEYAYQTHYGQMDYTKWCLNSSGSLAFRESDIIDNEVRLKSRFYNEFLKPRGLVHSMGCYIINEELVPTPGAIALYRDFAQANFTERDLDILNILLPHIENRMAQQSAHDLSVSSAATEEINARDLYLMNRYGFTRREIAVANELLSGASNAEIAGHLTISVHTVKKHVSHILQKAEVPNRIRLIQLLQQH